MAVAVAVVAAVETGSVRGKVGLAHGGRVRMLS